MKLTPRSTSRKLDYEPEPSFGANNNDFLTHLDLIPAPDLLNTIICSQNSYYFSRVKTIIPMRAFLFCNFHFLRITLSHAKNSFLPDATHLKYLSASRNEKKLYQGSEGKQD